MRVIVPGPLGWQSSLPIQMTRSPSTSLRAIAVFMMMPPDDRPRKKGGSMGATLTDGTAFSAVAPSQWPVCDAHQSKYSETVFRSCPPGPNTWTLNIQPLGQFRPHRGFLLARSTLLSSVARLLHTAGGRAVPSLCGLRLPRAMPCAVTRTHALQQMPRRKPERPRFR
jgi:hypothetical protein